MDKISQQNQTIEGPAVDNLIQIVQMMFGRGAPVEWDDQGFNKYDYRNQVLQDLNYTSVGQPIEVSAAVVAIKALEKYKKRQLTNWDQLAQGIQQLINQTTGFQGQIADDFIVKYVKPDRFGLVFYIPGMKRKGPAAIKQALEVAYRNQGLPVGDAWKAFNAARNYGVNMYRVQPAFMPIIKPILDQLGYDTTEFQAPEGTEQKQQEEKIVTVTLKEEGGQSVVNVQFPYNKALVLYTKKAPRRKFNKENNTWDVFNPTVSFLIGLKQLAETNGYEASSIDDVINKLPENAGEIVQNSKKLAAFDICQTGNCFFHVGLIPENNLDFKELAEFTRFCFPMWIGSKEERQAATPAGLQEFNEQFSKAAYRRTNTSPNYGNGKSWAYELKGNFSDYFQLETVINRFGYDTSELKGVIKSLYKSGDIELDKIPGVLDGYRVDDPDNPGRFKNDREKFDKELDKYNATLWDAQKDGVAFMYGRKSCLLGDETGAGKCVSPNTLINTSEGVLPAEDLWNKFSINPSYGDSLSEQWAEPDVDIFVNSVNDDGKIVKAKVSRLYRENFKGKLRKITTANGKEIITSFPHKFLTSNGWRNDINEGDTVCSSSNQPTLYSEEKNVDQNFAIFMAYQIAEGCESCKENNHSDVVAITQKDVSILNMLKNIFDNDIKPKIYDMFGKNANCILRTPKNGKCSYITITSVWYRRYLESLGYEWGFKSKDKKIPENIMKSNDELVKVFLRHFFDAEGYVSKRTVAVTSASKYLIYQISVLLQRFNILCSFRAMRKCATNGSKIKRDYYELRMIGSGAHIFMDKIGFEYEYEYKQKTFTDIKTKTNYNKEGKPAYIYLKPFLDRYDIPSRLLDIPSKLFTTGQRGSNSSTIRDMVGGLTRLKTGDVLDKYKELKTSKWTRSTIATLESVEEGFLTETINSLEVLANNDLQYEKVIKVETIDYEGYIYDFTVDKYHNYIAQNLICHNTYELVAAADMRLKNDGGRALIVTLNSTKKQFANEVEKLTGDTDISFDPTTGSKWTILRWNDFTAHVKVDDPDNPVMTGEANDENKIRRRDLLTRNILAQKDFTVLILDEVHNCKNDSIQTSNVQAISSQIPYVWGASATFIANKPIDAYNQLKTIGHRLGQMPLKTFKEHFGGWTKTAKGKLKAGDERQTMEAAAQLRKWLTLSGVYLKRSKRDINPDLPYNIIEDNPVEVDVPKLFEDIAQRYIDKEYKDPSLTISQLQAARAEIAKAKVPFTLNKAKSVLLEGKKIIVFTAFTKKGEAGDMLRQGLQSILDKELGGGKVVGYTSNEKQDLRQQNVAQMKNENSDVKAMVIGILAGGTGLDLPNVVSDVIMNDFSWTPKDAEQAEGRAFRITSETDINTTYIVASNSPDQELYEYVQMKKRVANMIQDLTKMETAMIQDGRIPDDIHRQIAELQQQDNAADVHVIKYLNQFMGKMRNSGTKMTAKKNWYKTFIK